MTRNRQLHGRLQARGPECRELYQLPRLRCLGIRVCRKLHSLVCSPGTQFHHRLREFHLGRRLRRKIECQGLVRQQVCNTHCQGGCRTFPQGLPFQGHIDPAVFQHLQEDEFRNHGDFALVPLFRNKFPAQSRCKTQVGC